MYLHFWYLYFISIILTTKVMPWSGTSSTAISTSATQRGCGTILTTMDTDSTTLYAINRNRYTTIIIQQ